MCHSRPQARLNIKGVTAGRAQSMFDFYADAINYKSLRGSNAVVTLFDALRLWLFGDPVRGGSARPARRDWGSTIASGTAAPVTVNGISATSFQAQPAGARVPEIVGNFRFDQPWGAAQLSAAAHQIRASLFGSTALTTPMLFRP
jgi:hypothetical protein